MGKKQKAQSTKVKEKKQLLTPAQVRTLLRSAARLQHHVLSPE
jgi:ribosomal protein S15P/S13E